MRQLKPVLIFGVLAFVLLGLVPLTDFLLASTGEDLDKVALRASEQTGLVWTSNLLVVIRMAIAEPALLALLVGSMVPALAALIALIFIKRPGKWAAFFGRLNPLCGTPLKSAVLTYSMIFVILIPVLILVLHVRQLSGGDYVGSIDTLNFAAVLMLFSLAFLDQGAVLEELGWRGFMAPELQRTMDSPLRVAIIVGVFWGLWHLPRDLTTGVVDRARDIGLRDCLSSVVSSRDHLGFSHRVLFHESPGRECDSSCYGAWDY